MSPWWQVVCGDARARLEDVAPGSVRACVTSPPYWGLRDYGVDGQLGLEETPEAYVAALVDVLRGVRRVLTDDGTLWLNLGDSYAGSWGAQGKRVSPGEISRNSILNHPKRAARTGAIRGEGLKPKDLIGIPWMVAFALRGDGWYLRSDIVWAKPNPMPESVSDRPTNAHEHVFLLSKARRYFYDADAIREPHTMRPQRRPAGRQADATPRPGQPRQAWSTAQRDHVGVDGHPLGRNARNVWTIELNPEYAELARHRIRDDAPLLNQPTEATTLTDAA